MVCHYGQHSFGHYICYRRIPRRGPKGEWVPPTLVDPLRMEGDEIDAGMGGEVETETDADGTIRTKKGPKQNGNAKGRPADDYFSLEISGTGSTYYWEDHTEMEAGSNRGWLRISDDSVEECGIERVLVETSGVFMLYYERAVHPKAGLYSYAHRVGDSQKGERGRKGKIPNGDPGVASRNGSKRRSRSSTRTNGSATEVESEGLEADTDADEFSIGSEETLKPQLRVVNLNGSVGSLVSEVGVGVLKKEKSKAKADKEKERGREREKGKEKDSENERMSVSLYLPDSSSNTVGAHIIRNVTAGRPKMFLKPTHANGNEKENGLHPHSSSSSNARSPQPTADSPDESSMRANGDNNVDALNERIPQHMIASAPSILHWTSSSSTSALPDSHATLGSRSTKVMHHPPLSVFEVQVNGR